MDTRYLKTKNRERKLNARKNIMRKHNRNVNTIYENVIRKEIKRWDNE